MRGTNVDIVDSDNPTHGFDDVDEYSIDESAFEDAIGDKDVAAVPIGQADQKNDKSKKKRKRQCPRRRFLALLQAVKRRRLLRKEFERQLDPTRFDDSENISPESFSTIARAPRTTPLDQRGRPFRVTRKEKTDSVNKNLVNTVGEKAGEASQEGASADAREATNKGTISHNGSNDDDFVISPRNRNSNRTEHPEDRNQNKNNAKSSNYFNFDENKFFSLPSFRPEVRQEAFRRIYAAIETPLKELEEKGYEAYRQYMEDSDVENDYDDPAKNDAGRRFRKEKGKESSRGLFRTLRSKNSSRRRREKEEESIQKSLSNAIVDGDPREYQRKIFEIAKQRNTIVNLGTGAGKTFIALLLIRDIWSAASSKRSGAANKSLDVRVDGQHDIQDSRDEASATTNSTAEKKQTLFLVPSVALAIQQDLTLRANLPHLNVERACDANANSKKKRATLSKCDLIVATHGAIQDLLMHYGDIFRMDRFNLVVIDECHYAASGNHAYRHLMKKFYHPLELQKRPRVLGLTASPLLNVRESHDDRHLSTMLDNLETTLDSKMVSAAGLVAQHANESITEDSESPVQGGDGTNGFLLRTIDEQTFEFRGGNTGRTIPSADNLDLLPSRYREFKQLEQLYKDLGSLVLTIYCKVLRRELSKNIFENESTKQFNGALNHLKRIEDFCSQETKFLSNMGRNDKILALEELVETLIEEKGGSKTIGLVFVERRITAIALQCYFLWRNEQILDGIQVGTTSDWKFAKQARHKKLESDYIFELNLGENKNDQGNGHDGQFYDSIDDPLHLFQRQSKPWNRVTKRGEFRDEMIHAKTVDSFRFIDAETDSHEEKDDTNGSQKIDSFRRLGRVAVKPVALVRNPVHIFNSLSMTQKNSKESEEGGEVNNWVHRELNIRDVLDRLRRGDVNLMFATSVVEEGVDVQACSFVVAFDGLTNIKSYIQMKGRARKEDAKFFVFRDPDDATRSQMELRVAKKMERRIQRFVEERMRLNAPRIRDISFEDDCVESGHASPKEVAAVEAGIYKVGNAIVDIQSAKSLLNRYFLSIPMDPFVRHRKESLISYMPCFEGNRLILPVHLPSDIRTVVLPASYDNTSRREKEKLLSLMACVRLHCYGLLNDRLLPLTRKDMHTRILRVATQKLQAIEKVPLNLDSFYNDSRRHFFVYPLHQKGHFLSRYFDILNGEGHTLGLITTSPFKFIEALELYHTQFGKVDISVGEAVCVSCSKTEHEVLQQIFLLLMNSRWSRRSRNIFYEMRTKEQYDSVIPPYLVGLLSANGELDWKLMHELVAEKDRCVEERCREVGSFSSTVPLPKPRICCTSNNKFSLHVVFGPTGKSCGAKMSHEPEDFETYCEYYKNKYSIEISRDCPLFRTHRIWLYDSGMPTKPRSKGSSSTDSEQNFFQSFGIPQQLLIEEPLANAEIALLCLFLPQILYSFERQQKTEAFIKHCETHIPTLGNCFRKIEFSRVALAVTSRSCDPNENYEGWEWVGDAVLKLLQTDSILKSSKLKNFVKFLHEGDLSMLRSAMGTNERLREICTHLRLENYILTIPLARGKWIPSPLQIRITDAKVNDNGTQRLKILADVIESILGMIYLEFGYYTSVKVANELHVTFPWDETDTSVACGEIGDIDNSELLEVLQKCTGHTESFSRPKIVSEAFTHPSAIDASVPSYQRLEWIGDAVLCLCAREWLFRNLGEQVSLGDLVVSEGAIVCNETLGFLSMKFGLQEYLNHRDQSLPKRIESYCWNIQEGCGFWGGDPPKAIADVVEAILGAVHVGSKRGFECGQYATRFLTSSIFAVFEQASARGPCALNSLLKTIKHPKKNLQEMSGQLLDVMVCTENDFVSSYHERDENSTTNFPIPQILERGEWRNAVRGIETRGDSCQVAFISILGRPLLVVADESITVAKNRASSLVREAIEHRPELQKRLAECRSNVECGLTFANKISQSD